MEQAIIAIAVLCGNPTYNRLSEKEVLQCQQYYITCLNKKKNENPKYVKEYFLSDCITSKKQLGGLE